MEELKEPEEQQQQPAHPLLPAAASDASVHWSDTAMQMVGGTTGAASLLLLFRHANLTQRLHTLQQAPAVSVDNLGAFLDKQQSQCSKDTTMAH